MVDRKTVQLIDGKWYRVAHGSPPYRHECCSCGHEHVVKYKVENGVIWEQWTTDDKATSRNRKRAGIKVTRAAKGQ